MDIAERRVNNGMFNSIVNILSEILVSLLTIIDIPIIPPSRIIFGDKNVWIENAESNAPSVIPMNDIKFISILFWFFILPPLSLLVHYLI